MSKKKRCHKQSTPSKANGQSTRANKSSQEQAKQDAENKIERSRLSREAKIQQINDWMSVATHLCLAACEVILLVLLIVILFILIILFVLLAIVYIWGSNNPGLVGKIITIIQLVSGVVSLFIGCWGIALSYQAIKGSPSHKAPIIIATIPSAVKAKGTNEGVNLNSIE